MAAFRAALTRTINGYAEKSGVLKKEKVTLTGDDMREGLTAIVSVKLADPKFSSQTKDKLVSSRSAPAARKPDERQDDRMARGKSGQCAPDHLQDHRRRRGARGGQAGARADPAQGGDGHRLAARQARRLPGTRSRPSANCSWSRATSAGGSAKQGRDRNIQAILPLKGKILNVERARFDRMLGSKEIGTMIQALGTSIGREEFNLEKLRYHKIVIMTDADVDGAHIRTLLLTFFYRQMPELIEGGHLYIAQPPLYKVARGRSEVYVKDDAALDEYLVGAGLEGLLLETAEGPRSGADLRHLVEHARRVRTLMAYAPKKYNHALLEALALSGALAPDLPADKRRAAIEKVSSWLGRGDEEARWTGELAAEGGYLLKRLWRGVTDAHIIEPTFLASAEARKLHTLAAEQADDLCRARACSRRCEGRGGSKRRAERRRCDDDWRRRRRGRRRHQGQAIPVTRPSELLEAVLAAGRKGLSIQRYKGLGEMNAEQLWETTLDPANRSLLRVEVPQADVADEIFTRLMGDVVEPRREFIQENALSVANLDV